MSQNPDIAAVIKELREAGPVGIDGRTLAALLDSHDKSEAENKALREEKAGNLRAYNSMVGSRDSLVRQNKALRANVTVLQEWAGIVLNSLNMFKSEGGATADQFVSGAGELKALLATPNPGQALLGELERLRNEVHAWEESDKAGPPFTKIIKELQSTFDLQWKADMRAIKRWQEAHPERDDVWPDRANMVVWLMEKLTQTERSRDAAMWIYDQISENCDDSELPHWLLVILEAARREHPHLFTTARRCNP